MWQFKTHTIPLAHIFHPAVHLRDMFQIEIHHSLYTVNHTWLQFPPLLYLLCKILHLYPVQQDNAIAAYEAVAVGSSKMATIIYRREMME